MKTLLWSTALKFYLLLKKLISTIEVALVFNMGNMVINMSKQPKYWKPITASEYYEGKFSLYATVLYWCSRWVCKVMIFRFRTPLILPRMFVCLIKLLLVEGSTVHISSSRSHLFFLIKKERKLHWFWWYLSKTLFFFVSLPFQASYIKQKITCSNVPWKTFYKKHIFLSKFNVIINYDSESFGTKPLLKI